LMDEHFSTLGGLHLLVNLLLFQHMHDFYATQYVSGCTK
jgi:hypothetical protein